MGNQYRLHSTLLGLSGDDMPVEPHPTEFFEEADESNLDLWGQPIALGKPHAIWNHGNNILSAEQWGFYMGFVGSAPSAWVYIVTRTNQIAGGEYVYAQFRALMHRPTGTSRAHFRFENVVVEFTELEAL